MIKYTQKQIDEHIYNMKTRGYSVFQSYFTDKEVEVFKIKLLEDIQLYDPSLYQSDRSKLDRYHIHDLMCKSSLYIKMLEDARLDQLLAPILGESWIMYAFTSSSAAPKSTNYGGRVHVDCPRWIDKYPTNIGVLWTLDDFNKKNGATKVLPASHHDEMIPSKEYFEANAIDVECPKGSIVIFDARVVHSTGFNSTNEFRHALTLNACRSYMKQRMDWVEFIPKSITDKLNNQARRIIGFDTRLPKSLEEFFVPEDKRLYKANQG